MKQIFTLSFFLFAFTAFAQSFSVGNLESHVDLNGTNLMSNEVLVKNKTAESITIKWEKIDITMPEGWASNICDFACYLPSVTSKEFTLNANQELKVLVDVTPDGVHFGAATVDVKFSLVGGTETYTGTYTFAGPLANKNLEVANLKLFPNPVTDYFTIENGQNVASVEIINILGTKVLSSAAKQVDVTSLNSGLYFVRLTDAQGRILATRRLQKN